MRSALVLAIGLASSWAGAANAAPAHAMQPVVTVLAAQVARSAPDGTAMIVGKIAAQTPITAIATVLPVLGSTASGWLRVALPGRPNGRSGWIRAAGTHRASVAWQLTIDLSNRSLTALRDGRVVRRFRAIVGKPATPTPTGSFFVEEVVKLGGGAVGGPYALALSARSAVLQEFDGGPGQIAVHGRDNVGGALGTAASHGCVRLSDYAMRWLAGRIDAGTRVTINS